MINLDQATAMTIGNFWFASLGVMLVVMASIYFYATHGHKITPRKS